MTLQKRDKRALWILAGTAVAVLILHFSLAEDNGPKVVAPSATVSVAEKRLARLRQLVANLPAKEQAMKAVSSQMVQREKGLIQAETAAQAQAQLLQIVRRIANAQAPAVEIRTVEMGQIGPLGQDYAEVSVPVTFDCRIEQLLNLLADLTAQPEALATGEIKISAANAKEKAMTVRLTVSGVTLRRLLPEKKGLASF